MKTLTMLMGLSTICFGLLAQNVGISDDGNSFTPNNSSILELKSTSKGILIPRLTYSQRMAISAPAQGLMVYQSDGEDKGQGFYYNSSATSTTNWIYLCNSEISTRENYVLVKSLSDFPSPVSGTITLQDSTTYEINGSINLGSNIIEFGSNCALIGANKFTDQLIYTGTGNFLNIDNKSTIIKGLTITATITGSQVFNSTGSSHLIQLFDIMFSNCKNLGEFNGGFAVNLNNCAVQGCSEGFTFKGTLQHLFYNNNKHCTNTGSNVNIPSGTFNSVQIQNNYFEIESGHTGLDIDADNTSVGDAKIVNNFFHGSGTYVANVTHDYEEWFFFGNTDLEDSSPSGFLTMDNNTNVTSIASADTYYKVAGNNYSSTCSQFDTNGVNNRLRYTGSKIIKGDITLITSLLPATSNKYVYVAVKKNGTEIVAYQKIKPQSTSIETALTLTGETTLDQNDYLEVYVKTQGATFNVTMVDMQFKVNI